MALATTPADAEPPPVFWEACSTGGGAGQCTFPRGVAADLRGHVFVDDQTNHRVDELDAWGQFVKAWGYNVVASGPDDTVAGKFEVCNVMVHPSDVCQAGTEESNGAGGFSGAQGVAVDSEGDIYVYDNPAKRLQKFDPTVGPEETVEIVWVAGKNVNKTKVEEVGATQPERDLCTAESGNECKTGESGTAPGEFSGVVGAYVAVDRKGTATASDDMLYVGDAGRIQRFDTSGHVEAAAQIGTPKTVQSLAVDSAGNLYVAYQSSGLTNEPNVRKLNPAVTTATELCTYEVGNPRAIAVAPTGELYAFSKNGSNSHIVRFGSTCSASPALTPSLESFGEGLNEASTGLGTGAACLSNGYDVYFSNGTASPSFVRAYGPPPDEAHRSLCPQPAVPPQIVSQFAVSVGIEEATVQATINPQFWGDTRYYLEYGTQKCSEGACLTEPAPPGLELGGIANNSPRATQAITLASLQPGTTYHYRFVAESGGGGPVFGEERAFTTVGAAVEPKLSCPNQSFRSGAATNLPDCRAYEMVSPVDKEGGDVVMQETVGTGEPAGLDLSAADGGKFTFSSFRSFDEPESAPYTSQYIATRHEGEGWLSENISPPVEGRSPLTGGLDLDSQYKEFSEDLCDSWLVQYTEPRLDPAAPAGFADIYRHNACGGGYQALSTATPVNAPPEEFLPELQGTASSGDCAVFRAVAKLTSDASTHLNGSGKGNSQVYENCAGSLRLISVLPGGTDTASEEENSAGTLGRNENHDSSVWHAVSGSGSRIYWSAAPSGPAGSGAPGKIYVRDNATAGGTECVGESSPCTYLVTSATARFWGATPSGSAALFTAGGELFEYDFATKTSTAIAKGGNSVKGVEGVLGYSEDLSSIYFASTEALTGTEENSAGRKAEAGKPNLYLDEGGTFRYVTTLGEIDLPIPHNKTASPLEMQAGHHVARVTSDGSVAAFTSSTSLTGYDNTDRNSGNPDAEIYVYDAAARAGAGALFCVSCEPGGARPVGRDVRSTGTIGTETFWAAAYVAPWPTQLRASHVLSDDGSRLFFESYGPLVLRDTNGARDVYEWEAAASEAECEEDGAEQFVASAAGCLSLISSGRSPEDSEFVEATADGSDVFIATSSSLVSQDPGLVDIYDARENGGLPAPPAPAAACAGEACQGTPSAPNDATPASSAFEGAGNLEERRQQCRNHQIRRKGRCVARHAHRRHAKRHRRAAL